MNATSPLGAAPLRLFLNPKARDGAVDRIRHAVERSCGDQAEVIETTSPEESRKAVHRACDEGHTIAACGGDGTVHAVINAMMETSTPTPLVVIPMGTSNNFCRDLGQPVNVEEVLDGLGQGVVTPIDLLRVTVDGRERYCATVATAGNADRVIEAIEDDDKQRWGAWCYLRAALPVMADLETCEVNVSFDGGPTQSRRLWNTIIANGRYAGGGLDVAPRARLDDGLLDAILIEEGVGLDLASLASEFLLGDYLLHERVTFQQVRRLDIESAVTLRFLVDGEPAEGRVFCCEAMPGALRVLVPRTGSEPSDRPV
jgi:diacylglycerol kinase (ATP)